MHITNVLGIGSSIWDFTCCGNASNLLHGLCGLSPPWCHISSSSTLAVLSLQMVVVWNTAQVNHGGEVVVLAKAHTDVDIQTLKIAFFDDTR